MTAETHAILWTGGCVVAAYLLGLLSGVVLRDRQAREYWESLRDGNAPPLDLYRPGAGQEADESRRQQIGRAQW